MIEDVIARLRGKVQFSHTVHYTPSGEVGVHRIDVNRPAKNPQPIFPDLPKEVNAPVTTDLVVIILDEQGKMMVEVLGYDKYPGPMSICHHRKWDATVDEVVAEALKGQVTHG